MATGPNVAIGITVVMLLVVAGLLGYQGRNMVNMFARTMLETRRAREERLRWREEQGAEADNQA